MLTGGCRCGAIRYQAGGAPFNATICHCTDCRGVTGAPMVAWFTVKTADLAFIQGTPKLFASSAKVTRSFCADCGTALTYYLADHPDEIDLTTTSLDDPGAVPPADHTYARSRLPWVHLDDGLPQYPTRRVHGL